MSDQFDDELKIELDALSAFLAQADKGRRLAVKQSRDSDDLELPHAKALIAVRFETARLRNRLADAEKRLTELEKAVVRAQ